MLSWRNNFQNYKDAATGCSKPRPDLSVVGLFFLNDNEEYVEILLGPYGQHAVFLLQGKENIILDSLPLDYTVISRVEGSDPTPVGAACNK